MPYKLIATACLIISGVALTGIIGILIYKYIKGPTTSETVKTVVIDE